MIRQPQHDYDDGSPIDPREEIVYFGQIEHAFRHCGINVGTGMRAVSGQTGRLSGNTAQAARL